MSPAMAASEGAIFSAFANITDSAPMKYNTAISGTSFEVVADALREELDDVLRAMGDGDATAVGYIQRNYIAAGLRRLAEEEKRRQDALLEEKRLEELKRKEREEAERKKREEEELEGCIDETPGDERTALFRIDVIEIPVDNPTAFPDGHHRKPRSRASVSTAWSLAGLPSVASSIAASTSPPTSRARA